jgi:nuclear transport factor 2 (NTF2) superfamily protein
VEGDGFEPRFEPWRNRIEFLEGRDAIKAFLTRKWQREYDYRLIKEVWAYRENRIAVRFAYEWRDDSGNWFRSFDRQIVDAGDRRHIRACSSNSQFSLP